MLCKNNWFLKKESLGCTIEFSLKKNFIKNLCTWQHNVCIVLLSFPSNDFYVLDSYIHSIVKWIIQLVLPLNSSKGTWFNGENTKINWGVWFIDACLHNLQQIHRLKKNFLIHIFQHAWGCAKLTLKHLALLAPDSIENVQM